MNNNYNRPFELAKIDIVKLSNYDVITASPSGPNPFPGEDDEFGSYYWD